MPPACPATTPAHALKNSQFGGDFPADIKLISAVRQLDPSCTPHNTSDATGKFSRKSSRFGVSGDSHRDLSVPQPNSHEGSRRSSICQTSARNRRGSTYSDCGSLNPTIIAGRRVQQQNEEHEAATNPISEDPQLEFKNPEQILNNESMLEAMSKSPSRRGRGRVKDAPRVKDDDDDDTKISKSLAWVLRRNARDLGLDVDDEGWVPISQLLELDVITELDLTEDELKDHVDHCPKQRFEISGTKIRTHFFSIISTSRFY